MSRFGERRTHFPLLLLLFLSFNPVWQIASCSALPLTGSRLAGPSWGPLLWTLGKEWAAVGCIGMGLIGQLWKPCRHTHTHTLISQPSPLYRSTTPVQTCIPAVTIEYTSTLQFPDINFKCTSTSNTYSLTRSHNTNRSINFNLQSHIGKKMTNETSKCPSWLSYMISLNRKQMDIF